jgi:hypothetical protein
MKADGTGGAEISVNNYAALWEMIRNNYNGRLVDVLDVTV